MACLEDCHEVQQWLLHIYGVFNYCPAIAAIYLLVALFHDGVDCPVILNVVRGIRR